MDESKAALKKLLFGNPVIAIVGLSSDVHRPSYEVSEYMQTQGFRIIPVNPTYAGRTILGEHCYKNLSEAADKLKEEGSSIDIVNCFRKAEHMVEAVNEAIAIQAKCVWMQLGVANNEAARNATNAGLMVVMDKCIKIEYALMRYDRNRPSLHKGNMLQ